VVKKSGQTTNGQVSGGASTRDSREQLGDRAGEQGAVGVQAGEEGVEPLSAVVERGGVREGEACMILVTRRLPNLGR
jgi:hypothetical protein